VAAGARCKRMWRGGSTNLEAKQSSRGMSRNRRRERWWCRWRRWVKKHSG
jgi:poly(3-hydroxyalkanoate) synthetase